MSNNLPHPHRSRVTIARGGGGAQGQISTRDGASHAYAQELLDVQTALDSLNHINGKHVPLLAAIALDKAYEALWSAKRAFDTFAHIER